MVALHSKAAFSNIPQYFRKTLVTVPAAQHLKFCGTQTHALSLLLYAPLSLDTWSALVAIPASVQGSAQLTKMDT